MTAVEHASGRSRPDSVFYISMAAAVGVVTFIGFSRSFYLKSVFHAPPELSALMVAHGLAFTTWVAVLMTQTGFVAAGRRDLHRRLGGAGIALAGLMVVLGLWLAIDALRRGFAPVGAPPAPVFFAIPFFDMIAFAAVIAMGYANRRRLDWHKRLMILSNAALMDAAFARFPLDAIEKGGAPLYFLLADLFVVAMAVYDGRTLKRIHPATLWAGGIVIASQVIRLAVSGTAAWASFAGWLAGQLQGFSAFPQRALCPLRGGASQKGQAARPAMMS